MSRPPNDSAHKSLTVAHTNSMGARRVDIVETIAIQFLSGPISVDLDAISTGLVLPDATLRPGWPLLLRRDQLCAYLGMSWSTIAKICPVAPVDVGANVALYSRTQIDDWIATRPPRRKRFVAHATVIEAPPTTDAVADRRMAALNRALARAAKRR